MPALGDEIAYWCPSEDDAGNGTTTLNDLSANSYNGTLTNMDAATDWVADAGSGGVRAIDHDGINDHIRIPFQPFQPFADFTWTAWINHSAPAARTIFSVGAVIDEEDGNAEFKIQVDEFGTLSFSGRNDANSPFLSAFSTPKATTGSWHFVALVRSGNNWTWWVNNQSHTFTQSIAGTFTEATFMTIAASRQTIPGVWIPMRWDAMRLFNRALSLGEIETLYGSRTGGGGESPFIPQIILS